MSRVFRVIPPLSVALCLLSTQVTAQTKPPKAAPVKAAPRAVSVGQYRQFLEAQKQKLDQIEKRAPRNVTPVLNALNSAFIVKRSDGATQKTDGDSWSRTVVIANGKNFGNLTKSEVAALRKNVETQIKSLDEWNTVKEGTFFVPYDAKTTISQLEQSGQIRTRPHAWQQAIADGRKWVGDMWKAFLDWLSGLRPQTAAPAPNIPDMSWLWPVFWVCIVSLLAAIFYMVFRALGGVEWLAIRRRRSKPVVEFEGEDAQLLKLPPDELRDRAEAYARKGNYREALRHRFLAVLVNFDARGVWRYDLRRTNWEHIASLRQQEAWRGLVAPLSDLTRRFDRVRYGNGNCNESEWNQFQSDALKLENSIPKSSVNESKHELAGARS
jgi:small-conductance mechanosensitive channel